MKRMAIVQLWLAAVILGVGLARGATPVILDTDIGTDIDDTWALAYLLRSPKLDLKLVLTDTGDPRYRAAIAAKLLEAAGRTDVPVGLGKDFGPMREDERNQEPWVKDYRLEKYPGKVEQDGVGALIRIVKASDRPVTIIAIGAVPNLAWALQRDPSIAGKCRLVGMHGSFDLGYDGKPPAAPESNVRSDPAALRATLAAPWRDVLLTPLDTCGLVTLTGDDFQRVVRAKDDRLLQAVLENYRIFAPRVHWLKCDFYETRSTVLFDCVAVYLAQAEDLVSVQPVQFVITDDGYTRRDPQGVSARVALAWKDRAAFEHRLVQQLTERGGVR